MISVASAQDAVTAAVPGGDLNAMLMSALPFVLVFLVFYLVLVRPQMQAAKKHASLVSDLKKGDVVVIDGGLIGEIQSVAGSFVYLRIAEAVVVSVAREAVRTTLSGDAAKDWEAKPAKHAEISKKR